MVTVAYNAYCVISKEGDNDTYDGKTVGSRSWEVGATVNSLVVTLFQVIITRTGTELIFLSNWDPQFASRILGAMTQSCYIGTRGIRNRVKRGPYCTILSLGNWKWMSEVSWVFPLIYKKNLIKVKVFIVDMCFTIFKLNQ